MSLIPRAPADSIISGSGRAWVPVDDNNTTTFAYNCRVDRPLNADELQLIAEGGFFPPHMERGSIRLEQGRRIDPWLPTPNMNNDYLIDRNAQNTLNFNGI